MSTSIANLDSTRYVRVNVTKGSALLLQSNRDTVRVAFADSAPARDNTAFHQLAEKDSPLHVPRIDTNVYVLSMTDRASLTVTEMASEASVIPRTAFGRSVATEEITPVKQLKFDYGQTDELESFTDGGSVSTILGRSVLRAEVTDADGIAVSVSDRTLIYRSGEGYEIKGTLRIDKDGVTGTADGSLIAGGLGVTDGLGFGEKDNVVGLFYQHHGECHIEDLIITAGTVGADDAVVTIDDEVYVVPLAAGLTTVEVAFELVKAISPMSPGWELDAINNKVRVVNNFVADAVGTFDFTHPSAVAAWTEIQAGNNYEDEFIPASNWNIKPNAVDNFSGLVPFRIAGQYLGGGGILFEIEANGNSGEFAPVHLIDYAGTSTRASVRSPSFRVGISNENAAGAAVTAIETASMEGVVQGKIVFESPSKFESNTGLIGATASTVLTLRNRSEYGLTRSLAEMVLGQVNASSESSKTVELFVVVEPDLLTPVEFQYKDEINSIALVSFDTVPVDLTGANIVAGTSFVGTADTLDLAALDQILFAGDTISLVARIQQGPISNVTASLPWKEDK